MAAVQNLTGLAQTHKTVTGSAFTITCRTEGWDMSVFHQPTDYFIQTSLIGHIKLLRIMWTFFIRITRISPYGSTGTAGHLGNAQTQQFCSNCFTFSGRNNQSCIGYCKTDTGRNFCKGFIINTIIKLIRINVIGTF